MANPQTQDGHTQFNHEVMEHLICFNFPSPVPLQICLYVIRKTWGFKKKEDRLSLSQFQKAIKRSRPTIVHWLKWLVKSLLLVKGGQPLNPIYGFNKDFEAWVVKPLELVKARPFTSKTPLTKTSKTPLTHKRKKDNIQKKGIAAPAWILEICTEHNFKPLLNYGLIKSARPDLTDDKLKVMIFEIMAWREIKKKSKEISTTQVLNWLKGERPEALSISPWPKKGEVIYS